MFRLSGLNRCDFVNECFEVDLNIYSLRQYRPFFFKKSYSTEILIEEFKCSQDMV